TRYIKRGGHVWINIFPDRPLTKKPAEVRMGSGKGSPEFWVANIKPGRVMFELSGVTEEVAREALRLAAHKLPLKARIVRREAGEYTWHWVHLDYPQMLWTVSITHVCAKNSTKLKPSYSTCASKRQPVRLKTPVVSKSSNATLHV